MVSDVILIDDDNEDGIPLYSPFTGIISGSEDFDSEDRHKDPSLVFFYLGDIGEFYFVRSDVSQIVDEAFNSDSKEGQSLGKKEDSSSKPQQMVMKVVSIAESLSTRLKAEKKLNTVTFVQTGGWNGINVVCFEQGYLSDGEWHSLRRK